MYLKGCARQWGCNCAGWIAWHESKSNVWKNAMQSVVVNAGAAKVMAASH